MGVGCRAGYVRDFWFWAGQRDWRNNEQRNGIGGEDRRDLAAADRDRGLLDDGVEIGRAVAPDLSRRARAEIREGESG